MAGRRRRACQRSPPPFAAAAACCLLRGDAPLSPYAFPLLQYRPKSLDQFELHKDVAENLKKLVRWGLQGCCC